MNASARTLPADFRALAGELAEVMRQQASFNNLYEEYIARLPADVDVRSLRLLQAQSVTATERLADLFHLIDDLAPFEDAVRALAARGRALKGALAGLTNEQGTTP